MQWNLKTDKVEISSFSLNEAFIRVVTFLLLLVLLLRRLLLLLLLFWFNFLLLFLFFRFIADLLPAFQCLNQEEIASEFLFLILLGVVLVDTRPEVVGVTSECNVHHLEELVHSTDHAFRSSTLSFLGRFSAEYNDLVSKICRHNEIVLYDEGSFFLRHNPTFHDSCSQNTLF